MKRIFIFILLGARFAFSSSKIIDATATTVSAEGIVESATASLGRNIFNRGDDDKEKEESAAAVTSGNTGPSAAAGVTIKIFTCFSEVASVDVYGKGLVPMKQLQVGDHVFTGQKYRLVYAFGHRDISTPTLFLQIETDIGNSLEVTGNHLVFVNNKDGSSSAIRAESIKVGDTLWDGAKVTNIGFVERTGLYGPLITDGKLIVDGVMTSSYAPPQEFDNHFLFAGYLHEFSHLGVSPFRFLCTLTSTSTSLVCQDYNEDGIPTVLAYLMKISDWFLSQPLCIQIFAIATYILVSLMTWCLECIITLTTAFDLPSLVIVAGLVGVTTKVFGRSWINTK